MFCALVELVLFFLVGLGLLMLALALMLYLWRITVAIGLLMLAMVCWQEPRVFYVILGMAGGLLAYAIVSRVFRFCLTDKNNPCQVCFSLLL